MSRHFKEKDQQAINRCMKTCSTCLITTELQVKTSLRFHLTPTRMTLIKNATNISVGKDVGGKVYSYIAGGFAATLESSVEIP